MQLQCKVKSKYNIGDIICYPYSCNGKNGFRIGIIDDISVKQDCYDSNKIIFEYYTLIQDEDTQFATIMNDSYDSIIEDDIIYGIPKSDMDRILSRFDGINNREDNV